ncbi:hypothetical protein GGTG_02084 [Gaeumannomyces tritici R3-111a-1]|uniref:Extracellular membrane protein CFEM domain-containing protein n=1 Tax=Gaeumannomyces tritici (strain R3-111a-1) TaxID=644352 RepID=J3NLD6_GAET3|nr:hypothetical protein GGTG_02084 [Gaeumannomyces tritici R3-111a-1]EJT82110.1 hypothetical protein GGTG_02084 [Gaeumannomyces tritici R3-111a-1]
MKAQLSNVAAAAFAFAASALADPVLVQAPAAVEPRAPAVTPMQCYTEGPFLDCIKPLTAAMCTDEKDPMGAVSCACSQGSALYGCYTANCASDQFFSSYKAGLDACSTLGAGNGGTPAAATGAQQGGGGSGKTSSSSPAAATGTAKNAAAGPSAPRLGLASMGASLALVLGVAAWL